ncbi:MAG: hypothetical protein EA353_01625 [Puniceicoccaceae bacterium]|nr:MAG: hypothetical protein EA353_01625 [Puniceicoccaceae bacterium]
MFIILTLVAQVATPMELPNTVNVVFVGFLFVVIVLALLAAVTSTIGALFVKSAARDAARDAARAAQAAQVAQKAAEATAGAVQSSGAQTRTDPTTSEGVTAEDEDPALFSVIAAAVHTIIGDRPHRVVSVRSTGPGWAQEGRRQIFSSHRVR